MACGRCSKARSAAPAIACGSPRSSSTPTTGAHLWADRYDRDLTDIFEVQDDVTRRIVDALKVTLSPAEKARLADSETSNIDAYDCVLRGREFMLGKEKNRETFEQSIKFFKRALELDPNYSQAYAALGLAYMFDYQNRWTDDPDSSLQLAKHYAEQAIEKDPNEPLARLVASLGRNVRKGPRSGEVRDRCCAVAEPEFLWSLPVLAAFAPIRDSRWRRFRRLSTPCVSIPL